MLSKEEIKKYLEDGYSLKKISEKEGIPLTTLRYHVAKHNLKQFNQFVRSIDDRDFFSKVDTKEKAYIIGFILGDGYISNVNDVEIAVQMSDKTLVQDISSHIPWECWIKEDQTFDKKTRRYPRVRLNFRSRSFGSILVKMFGGKNKPDRNTPIISKELRPYLIAGLFDADGCITYGFRKDRNRLWYKVSFTCPQSILEGLQKEFLRHGISSSVYPKKGEKVFVMDICNLEDIYKLFKLLPNDGIRLQRKVKKFNDWYKEVTNTPLRLKLGELGEGSKDMIPSRASDHSEEGIETTGEKMGSLNNQLQPPSLPDKTGSKR